MSDLAQNPYFQRWIARNLARMDSGLRDKQTLTYGATRMVDLSIAGNDLYIAENPALERNSTIVVTNLMQRLRKPG